jgi:hypothetical protein
MAFLVRHDAVKSVKSLDGPGAGSVPPIVRIAVVVGRMEIFPSSLFVLRGMGWENLLSAFREWAGRPFLAARDIVGRHSLRRP